MYLVISDTTSSVKELTAEHYRDAKVGTIKLIKLTPPMQFINGWWILIEPEDNYAKKP